MGSWFGLDMLSLGSLYLSDYPGIFTEAGEGARFKGIPEA